MAMATARAMIAGISVGIVIGCQGQGRDNQSSRVGWGLGLCGGCVILLAGQVTARQISMTDYRFQYWCQVNAEWQASIRASMHGG